MCVCARACVRACVRAYVCVCVLIWLIVMCPTRKLLVAMVMESIRQRSCCGNQVRYVSDPLSLWRQLMVISFQTLYPKHKRTHDCLFEQDCGL